MVARKLAIKFGEEAERKEEVVRASDAGGVGGTGAVRHKGNRFCVNRDPRARQSVFSLFFFLFSLSVLPFATARHFVFPNL